MRVLLLSMMLSVPLLANAADDVRVRSLEHEVRNLQRQVLALSRRIDELSRPVGIATQPGIPAAASRASGGSDEWVSAAKWQRIRPGMSELEVIELLGRPTSMREENGARVLFYAMEIGSSGFLSGSVVLREREVAEVRKPELQ